MTAERIIDGFGNRGDGRFVKYEFNVFHCLVDVVEAADVSGHDVEIIGIRQVLPFTGGEIIENADPVAIGQQAVDDVGSDEAGAAGDQG